MARSRRDGDLDAAPADRGGGNYREISARTCAWDGALVETEGAREGWCPEGQGYAVAYRVRVIATWPDRSESKQDAIFRSPCPFVCPRDRERLHWDGWCHECWTQPGDVYRDDRAEVVPPTSPIPGPVPGLRYVPTGHYRREG